MTDETTEQIEPSAETLQQPTLADIMKAIVGFKKETDSQLEAIRQGIVHNSVSYDRLKAEVLMLRADVKELTEEVRQKSIKSLV